MTHTDSGQQPTTPTLVEVTRSFLVRSEQTFRGTLPANWDDMSFSERDQYICDNMTLVRKDHDTIDNDDLDFTVTPLTGYSVDTTATVAIDDLQYGNHIVFYDDEGSEHTGFVTDKNPSTNEVCIETGDREDGTNGYPVWHRVGGATVGLIER